MVHYYTHSRTQKTTSSFWTKRCNSCIQESFRRGRRWWNLHTRTVIWILGQYPYQRRFKETFTKTLSRTRRPQLSNSWTRIILLFCPTNGLLCGQHDFPQLHQKSVYGHFWISCLCFRILWITFLLLPVYQAHRWSHSYNLTTHTVKCNRLTGASLGFGKTLLSASYNLFLTSILTSVFKSRAPLPPALELEPTTTRIEDEIGDPTG